MTVELIKPELVARLYEKWDETMVWPQRVRHD